ncbi:hypothetical protein DB30_04248 [Enhygromyxa salina]|uniref:Phage holin family protein n=1 Tax=Enhygromyxa salina TaxID=215803 RepID=A0A0C1ZG78_9BACT|nr:phage holin family protein [Enhygromyxa salina]KIG16629.1 hypothetical protein DB30_04248 [Enhygromyxa salina]
MPRPSTRDRGSAAAPSLPAEIAQVAGDVVSLRAELLKLELLSYVEKTLNPAICKVVAACLVGVGGLFTLIAAALAIGAALGHLSLGMLIVGVAVIGLGGLFARVRPKLVSFGDKPPEVESKRAQALPITQGREPPRAVSAGSAAAGPPDHEPTREPTRAQLQRQLEARERLLASDLDELGSETRAHVVRYSKLAAVGVAGVAAAMIVGGLVWTLAGRRGGGASAR